MRICARFRTGVFVRRGMITKFLGALKWRTHQVHIRFRAPLFVWLYRRTHTAPHSFANNWWANWKKEQRGGLSKALLLWWSLTNDKTLQTVSAGREGDCSKTICLSYRSNQRLRHTRSHIYHVIKANVRRSFHCVHNVAYADVIELQIPTKNSEDVHNNKK